MRLLSLLLLLMFVVGCTSVDAELEESNAKIESLEQQLSDLNVNLTVIQDKYEAEINNANFTIDTLKEELADKDALLNSSGPVSGASLLNEASHIIHLLSVEDYSALSNYISPADNLRVSPYQYVNISTDIILTPSDVANLASYPSTTWGNYDGSGNLINLSGIDYFNDFVYDEDYENAPYIGQNSILSSGNMINNITEVYPNDAFIEFYFDGFDPAYSGMDWTSLTLVMRNIGGQWYLIGLVHGQWTI